MEGGDSPRDERDDNLSEAGLSELHGENDPQPLSDSHDPHDSGAQAIDGDGDSNDDSDDEQSQTYVSPPSLDEDPAPLYSDWAQRVLNGPPSNSPREQRFFQTSLEVYRRPPVEFDPNFRFPAARRTLVVQVVPAHARQQFERWRAFNQTYPEVALRQRLRRFRQHQQPQQQQPQQQQPQQQQPPQSQQQPPQEEHQQQYPPPPVGPRHRRTLAISLPPVAFAQETPSHHPPSYFISPISSPSPAHLQDFQADHDDDGAEAGPREPPTWRWTR
ncbi:uncharacterized protein E0L32_003251 [Thyridium curvatum]|uniref:Uncharacterized protein n=1 Tax=Thyridium curvatum TaxID=1093900 RepID=A0A507BC84_9PEZI|nr:uncharacterized protein E0L32_003251 [Thyridium curvatum]TPX17133.1 hypothetical protein E0L32_003251 [Thyridium curvatum]